MLVVLLERLRKVGLVGFPQQFCHLSLCVMHFLANSLGGGVASFNLLVCSERLTELEEKHATLERVSGRTAKAATEYGSEEKVLGVSGGGGRHEES